MYIYNCDPTSLDVRPTPCLRHMRDEDVVHVMICDMAPHSLPYVNRWSHLAVFLFLITTSLSAFPVGLPPFS